MSTDNPIAALRGHLDRWDSPVPFEDASGPESAYEMLSEVMDDVRVLLAVEDAKAVPEIPRATTQAEDDAAHARRTQFDEKGNPYR